jgi:hypothetical protein
MNIKKDMLILLFLVGYISFTVGLNAAIIQETERLEKETEALVNQIVDNLEEIYLTQQNNN